MPSFNDQWSNSPGVSGPIPNVHMNKRLNISQLDDYHGTPGYKRDAATANIGSTLGRGAFDIKLPGSNMSLGAAFLNREYGVAPDAIQHSKIEMKWGAATLVGDTYHTSDTIYNFSFAGNARSEDVDRKKNQAFGYAAGVGAQRAVLDSFDRETFVSSLKSSVGNFDPDVLSSPKKLSDWMGQDASRGEALLGAYSSAHLGPTRYDYSEPEYRKVAESGFNAQVNKMTSGNISGNASGIPGGLGISPGINMQNPVGAINQAWSSMSTRDDLRLSRSIMSSGPTMSRALMGSPTKTAMHEMGHGILAEAMNPGSFQGIDMSGSKNGNIPVNATARTKPKSIDEIAAISLAGPAMDLAMYGSNARSDTHRQDMIAWAISTGQIQNPKEINSSVIDKFYKEAGSISKVFEPHRDSIREMALQTSISGYKRGDNSRLDQTLGPISADIRSRIGLSKVSFDMGGKIPPSVAGGRGSGNKPPGVPPGFAFEDEPPTPPSGSGPTGPTGAPGSPDFSQFAKALQGLNAVMGDSIKRTVELTGAHADFIKQTGGFGGEGSSGGPRKPKAEESLPDFHDKLRPFLMGGAAGRSAREEAFGKGWYGEEGSAERSAWSVGGNVLGTANRALLGYRTMRHFGQELIDPLANAAYAYQGMRQSQNTGLMQSGSIGIGQLTTENQQLLNFQNARDRQQYQIGAAFQRAWLPGMTALAGAAPGGAGELASILGPSIAVGAGMSFLGQPELGLAAGLLTAGVGIGGTMQSAVTDPQRRASLVADFQAHGQGAIANSPFGYAGLALSQFYNNVSGTPTSGPIAQGAIMNARIQSAFTSGGKLSSPDDQAYLMDQYLKDNADKYSGLSDQNSKGAYLSTQKLFGNHPQGQMNTVVIPPKFEEQDTYDTFGIWTGKNTIQVSPGSSSTKLGSDTKFDKTANIIGQMQQSGIDAIGAISSMPALKNGYGFVGDMLSKAYDSTNGNMAVMGSYLTRTMNAANFTQKYDQIYGGSQGSSVANALYGGGDYYSDPGSVQSGANLMAYYNQQFDKNGKIDKDAQGRRQQYSRAYAAGVDPQQLANIYAANTGSDTSNAQMMSGMTDYAGSKISSMLDFKASPAEIQSYITKQGYTAGFNQYASQMSLPLLDTSQWQDLTSQQSGFMQSVISGDTTANSIFADQVPGNEWRRTIQTGSRGGTKGMHAYYDEAITPEVRDDVAATGRERGYIRGDGRYSVNALAGTNQVQREQMQYKEEIRTRDYDFSLAQKQLTRSQASTTGVGLGAIVAGFEGKGQYYFEDQSVSLNRAQQDFGYQQQGKQLDIQRQQMQYGFGYQQQQMNVQRSHQVTEQGWGLQDIAYQRSVSSMQYGFSMVDADENIRYARGRERRVAMRHRDEATIMHSMQTGQMDKEEERAKERIKWGDEQFNRDQQHFQQEKQFAEQNFNVQVENYRKQREFITQERQLEDQQRVLRRAINAIDMAEAKQSLDFHQLEKKTMDDLAGTSKVFNDRLTVMGAQVGFLPNQIQNANTALEAFSSHIAMVAQSAVSGGSYTPPPMQTYSGTSYQGIPIVSTGAARTLLQGPVPQGTIGVPMQPVNHVSGAGYASGGYTGDGPSYQPAGTVHKREFVVPEHGALVSHNPELVELMKQQNGLLKQILSEGGNAMIMVTDKNVGQLSKKARSLVDEAYVQ